MGQVRVFPPEYQPWADVNQAVAMVLRIETY